ncbi:hypothetical protein [Bacillus cereus]|uniref:hypothetical protein n=1 Tax=Bacillus cereus TaxID=1396 RepID=UPI001BA7D7EB|nr:hypothetical protein [Bacillus cereus]
MKKETRIQLESELESTESDLQNQFLHKSMLKSEISKTTMAICQLEKRIMNLKTLLRKG